MNNTNNTNSMTGTHVTTPGNLAHLEALCLRVRRNIIEMTTAAQSGHLTSSLSAVELIIGLMFSGVFKYDADRPDYINNDRLILSKGHAAPLLYAAWEAAGRLSKAELLTLRQFDSVLEGHPTMRFPYTEAPTGSLGQGLSIGLGMALNAQYLDKLPYTTYVLLGDSELSEGSNWEAMAIAAKYEVSNLVGIVDVNRLGQRGETLYGHNLQELQKKTDAFGWQTLVIDGHSLPEVVEAYQKAAFVDRPTMILAKTIKGKGVRMLEDAEGWHSKTLSEDEAAQALGALGGTESVEETEKLDADLDGRIALPERFELTIPKPSAPLELDDNYSKPMATKKAYGHSLVELYPKYPTMIALDAEVSNSTCAEDFKKAHPDKFFEMYIAEQNMVGVGVGLALRGKLPCISTFAAFHTRAFDQYRIAGYAGVHMLVAGSYVGVSVGKDGMTQMGLEDIAMMRTIFGSTVLYPADHVAQEKLADCALAAEGIVYMRQTREETPAIYDGKETFEIGGSHVLRQSSQDFAVIIAAGITLHEALKAYETLFAKGIKVRIIDVYSIKPLDIQTIGAAYAEVGRLVIIEDHFRAGGLGEAVMSALATQTSPATPDIAGKIIHLAVDEMPRSGLPHELLAYEKIDAQAITDAVSSMS